MPRFTQDEVESLYRLLPYANRKDFVADLLLNAYSSKFTVDMRRVMRYAAGEEPDSTYLSDIFVLLSLMERGVEPHELIGREAIMGFYPREKSDSTNDED